MTTERKIYPTTEKTYIDERCDLKKKRRRCTQISSTRDRVRGRRKPTRKTTI